MSDIILFRPSEMYSKNISNFRAPLGLLYIAAALKEKGFSTKIIDSETSKDWQEELKKALTDDVILVGLGTMTGYQIKWALEFSKEVRKLKSIPIVWGGLHPSFLPEQTVQHECVDIVVTGEGEATFSELACRIKDGKPYDDVPNLVFEKNGEIFHSPVKDDFLNMDELKLPDYSMVDVEYYANSKRGFMEEGQKRCLDLNPDRGCPFRCEFCYNLNFNHRRWRGMSAEKVLDAMEDMLKKYQLDAINFTSDNFFVQKDRFYKICSGMIERNFNIAWHADIRIDTFLKYDDDLLLLMKKSGCGQLTFGVESGSDRMLGIIKKDLTAAQVKEAHLKVKKLGFKVSYHFMVGFPDETIDDIIETTKLIHWLVTNYDDTHVYPSIYMPYPGTPLYDRSVELGFEPPGDLEAWINYDWLQTSKFSWFSPLKKRFIKETQTVISMAQIEPTNFFKLLINKYGKIRLFCLRYKLSLLDLDTSAARYCKYGS